ncbi:MAG: hypothetical protein H6807_01095 [Planctomycetes bacterium]|nr:hypothetical protein [Planctomycetota bacterium]
MTRLAGHHCAFCGVDLDPLAPWPRPCPDCGGTTEIGLITLVVVVAERQGRFLVGRGHDLHEEAADQLPARFLDFGETWRQTAARALGQAGRFRTLAARSDADGVPRLYCRFEGEEELPGRRLAIEEIGDDFDRQSLAATPPA